MAEGALMELAVKVSEYLVRLGADEVVSWWGVKDELKRLQDSMRMIKSVLVDAEKRQADGTSKEQLRRLRKVLYQADDLFDEVLTVKQQMSHSLKEDKGLIKVAKKVTLVFSKLGPIHFKFHVAGEIKSIRKELDAFKGDLDLTTTVFNLGSAGETTALTDHSSACLRRNLETSCMVNPQNIVGRQHDKENIVHMLLSDPSVGEASISVIPIVGFGGIGKTTLAQLVFNDDRVKNHFDLTKWVWIPEKDNKEVVAKICTAFTQENCQHLSLERVQSDIHDSIKDKRYLLVLDDVWDESRSNWLDLMNLLGCGKSGSKIIVTTRSFVVANNVGTLPNPYILQILSDEESWDLFRNLALTKQANNSNLILIGREIVKKCANVPLAIKTIGCALYSKDQEIEWRQFADVQLSKIDQIGSIDIIPALKLSYDQLHSQLKQCFAYFALFSKNTLQYRDFIVSQWIAQGFIRPPVGDSSLDLEDVGNLYFQELLSRNFLQDVIRYDSTGEVSFRVHNLMHDLATYVAGDEILLVENILMMDSDTKYPQDNLRHVSVYFGTSGSQEALSLFINAMQIRSLSLYYAPRIQRWDDKLSDFIFLRSLWLYEVMIERLPNSIKTLRHLRSLAVWNCPIKCLPSSFSRLWNLQYLYLQKCAKLADLSASFSRLINLRLLSLYGCDLLTETPPGFQKLKSLRFVSHFMVGKNNGLDALADMNLQNSLVINYRRWREDTILEARKAHIKGKRQLTTLELLLGSLHSAPEDAVMLLEELQPPESLKDLTIIGYQGERLPYWLGDGLRTWLPDLIGVTLGSFKRCRFLSSGISQLPFLKGLEIFELPTLEYLETRGKGLNAGNYFPCLEYLKLSKLPQLSEWLRVSSEEDQEINGEGRLDDRSQRPMLANLSTLEIYECPLLESMPLTPSLSKLTVKDINERLLTRKEITSSSLELIIRDSSFVSLSINAGCLKSLEVADCQQLMSISIKSTSSVTNCLKINGCEKLRNIQGLHHLSSTLDYLCIKDCEDLDELLPSICCLTALESLVITNIPKLRALPGSIGNLTKLRSLSIDFCPQLTSLPDTIGNLTQLRWLGIGNSPQMSSYVGSSSFAQHLARFTLLETLHMYDLPYLTSLPESIGNLPHLNELSIVMCPQLKALPNWFTNLTNLHKLLIVDCPHLITRCTTPHGHDCALIQHVPNVVFTFDLAN